MNKKKRQISRRDFIRYSAIGVSASTLGVTSGCSGLMQVTRSDESCLNPNFKNSVSNPPLNNIFVPSSLSKIKLKNRIIKAATALNLPSDNGKPTSELADVFVEICEGGVGAIITGGIAVQPNGASAFENALLIDKDENINAFKKIADAVHEYDTPIIMQVSHDGPITRRKNTGLAPVGPSAIADKTYNEEKPKALTELEIKEVIKNFIAAIGRAQKAGFDGVELFAAHGGLLSAFLSENSNIRTDKWGGSIENRFRIINEILLGARRQFKDYPIIIKVNAYDFQTDGMRVDQMVKIATLLENVGCDGIEVSCGVSGDGFSTVRVDEFPTDMLLEYNFAYKDLSPTLKKFTRYGMPLISWMYRYEPIYNYNVCAARKIKNAVSIPVIVVGGIRKLNDIEQIIDQNMADYVAMARPFITEPDIVNRFKDKSQIASECLECGHCILGLEDMAVECFNGMVP